MQPILPKFEPRRDYSTKKSKLPSYVGCRPTFPSEPKGVVQGQANRKRDALIKKASPRSVPRAESEGDLSRKN